jgi:hypothetical protein
VAPTAVMVSVLRSPLCCPMEECVAMSSFSSGYRGALFHLYIARATRCAPTRAPIDDSTVRPRTISSSFATGQAMIPYVTVVRADGQQAGTRHRPEQNLDERNHLHTNPNVTSANLTTGTVTRCRTNIRIWDLQYYEYSANYDTVEASPKDGVRNDRKCLVDYHVR